ncbi:cellulose binding domain-containing protein [Streptacidiphilus sp. N1-12]|uniref:Cellulose binding domain-containing protein n=2 Tax=Streptacidiphilus alkalitolerans TaxID=3342712 RepID=A0ABV6WSV2_9ACTN
MSLTPAVPSTARASGRRFRALGLSAVLTVAAALTGVAAAPARAAAAVGITVNAGSGLGTIPSGAIGLNTAVYDGNMNDAAAPGLIKAAGINALRYPGGSYSDIYNWQTNTTQGGYVAPNTAFSNFMGTAQAAGASPVITVNWGTGTPALAAAWVQSANVTNHDNIQYWEVGNEVYGNGTYGANWEADSHCTTSASGGPVTIGSEPSQTYNCGPGTYANGVLSYMSAMKAASPNIHVCAVLTTPGGWPDNVTNATTSPQSWNQTVLTALGSKTDCVIVHYYPGGSDAAAMMNDPSQISGIVSTLKSEISQYAKVDPTGVKIITTEANSDVDMDTQPNALFAADMYMTWMENGISNIDWWDQHNGPGTNPPSVVQGVQDYGDYGLLSSGGSSAGVTEPAVDTPFAPYYGIEMLSRLGAPGDAMVAANSGNPLVKVHAVRRTNGNLDLLVENEDPNNPYTANLTYNGFTPSGGATVQTYANGATSITSSTQSSASSVTVAPYSLTVLQLSGGGATTPPGPPGQPTVSNLSSTGSGGNTGSATLGWPAATAGTYPIAGYQVLRTGSGGTGSTVVGSPTGTTFNLTGLTVGSSYTYDVVAVDTKGGTSLPSQPVTFTVPPPGSTGGGSGCAVHYAVTNSWPGGFGSSVTITDNGSSAISGWNLTFTLPSGEAVQSGWNGTFSQSGQNVSVANLSWNSTIAANGGSVGIGFNGTTTGPTTAPAAFAVNGSACSTD